MGTWGHGVFDSDDALDFKDKLQDKLVQTIVFHLAEEKMTCWEPRDYGVVLAAADILYLWYEHHNLYLPVSKTVVRHWRELYLQRFDEQNYTGESVTQRLVIIETIFDRLETAAGDDC